MKSKIPISHISLFRVFRVFRGFTLFSLSAFVFQVLVPSAHAAPPKNFFANSGFEMGRENWHPSTDGKTECRFTVDEQDAAEGRSCAVLTVGKVEGWGLQFGQTFPAGEAGRTYTFAVMAKAVQGSPEVNIQIERSAKPYDRALAGKPVRLSNQWQELHVTATLKKDFHQGWFAYVSCEVPNVQFRVDAFRLYEGDYVPYQQAAKEEAQTVGVHLFDSGSAAAGPLPGEALAKRADWTEVPEDNTTQAFKGAAVLMNDRLALVLRKNARGAEVYSLGAGAPVLRATLAPAGQGTPTLESFTILENSQMSGSLEAVFGGVAGGKATLRYEVKMGQPFVQTEPRQNAARLRVEAPCRFALMPDFFADDIVIDAAELPVSRADLPSDNFFLHFLPGGEAIVMAVAKNSEEDIRIALSGEGEKRQIDASELDYGKGGKIWVAILNSPNLWHQAQIDPAKAGEIIPLAWQPPFPAQWRTDWRRVEGVTDSWEMIVENAKGFLKYRLFGEPDTLPSDRKRWTTVMGTFKYPCWIDKDGHAFLQPFKKAALQFAGPAIIYPLARTPGTALDKFTVVDIVRNTLGVGPCEYVLDVEGQKSEYKGRATCSTRDTLNPIYKNHQQVERKAEIERVLQDVMIFIRHIRGRIQGYVDFGHETLSYLAQQKQAHPDLAPSIEQLETLARTIDAKVAARAGKIKTPDDVAVTVEDFRKTVLTDTSDEAAAKCKRFTEAWVEVGGNQDELAGECRWAVKMLRQKAGLLMAADPKIADVAKEIRQRTQVVMRNPAGHEGARH